MREMTSAFAKHRHRSGPEVIKLFSTIVGILTFISRINYKLLSSKPEKAWDQMYCNFYFHRWLRTRETAT